MEAFTEVEVRVLGVLIEKALTSPSAYPLTINALVTGANQLQNRDPVVGYSESEVSSALRSLERRGLVAQSPPSPGARAVRFEHHLVEQLQWDRREQAVMAELMLRGRQTAGELRARASRMTTLPDLQSIVSALESLKGRATPFVEELPREPGRSANRFRHLLGGEPVGLDAEAPAAPSLEARVARLEADVAELKAAIAARPSNA